MKRIRIILLLAFLLATIFQPVLAQSLSFRVDREEVDVFVNQDGTATIEYLISFNNTPSGGLIDYVDIGLPTNAYDLGAIKGTLDGNPLSDFANSPYVTPGVAVGLGANAIKPGASGVLRVQFNNIRNLFYKTNKVQDVSEPYASFQFSPNSFGSEYVVGNSNVTVRLHLPVGLPETEPRYFTPKGWPGSNDPASYYDNEGRVVYEWSSTNADVKSQYIFGAAFPQRYLPASALVTEPVVNIQSEALCPLLICGGMVGFFGLVIWASVVGAKKRQMQYLPPKISIEGNGVKRGLTAIEAAILMEQPMDKVLSMILFSVIKKNAATVTVKDPLTLEVATPQPPDLRSYEISFLEAMQEAKPADKRKKLQAVMVGLVSSVTEKMRGFSRRESVAYYEDIMRRAWEQVEAANTPEVKMQKFDEAMDWTMLDRNFDDRSRRAFTGGPVYVPMWWGRYDPNFGHSGMSRGSTPSIPQQVGQAPGTSSLPSLPGSDFAASMVNGVQTFASGVIGDVTGFTGAVTNVTNPVPKPTTSSGGGFRGGGGGGGRSCACACACAGCACACAGGGR